MDMVDLDALSGRGIACSSDGWVVIQTRRFAFEWSGLEGGSCLALRSCSLGSGREEEDKTSSRPSF